MAKVYATGRRKTAIAKVWLENGNGQLTINGQSLDQWLGGHDSIKKRVMQPLHVSKQESSVNIIVKTLGGGYSAQADAARHGISRALVAYDEQFRTILKPHGLLTRDAKIFSILKTLIFLISIETLNVSPKKIIGSFKRFFFCIFSKEAILSLPFFMPNILAFYYKPYPKTYTQTQHLK